MSPPERKRLICAGAGPVMVSWIGTVERDACLPLGLGRLLECDLDRCHSLSYLPETTSRWTISLCRGFCLRRPTGREGPLDMGSK